MARADHPDMTYVHGKTLVPRCYALKAFPSRFGVEVIDLGAERDPEYGVAAAEREGWSAIAVSTRSGQCLAYQQRLMPLCASSAIRRCW